MDNKNQEKTTPHKILAILPRAADVVLTCAATLAKYAKNGWKIVVVVVTSSERETEKKELAASGKILGIHHAYFLKYKTGGLKQAGVDNPKMDIYEIFREEKPDIILTVARHGFSTNPDATTTSLATTLAYEKYSQNSPASSIPLPHFYFFCFPEQFLSFAQSKGFFRKDASGFSFEGISDKKITHIIDTKNFVKQKIEALRIHRSAQIETSRMIELLKTYRSSWMDYYVGIDINIAGKISNRL